MTLAGGDLTTLSRVKNWIPNLGSSGTDSILIQLITSCSQSIYAKLSRARLYNQTFTRYIDGVGNYQLVLPDYPVTAINSIQMGAQILNPSPLPVPNQSVIPPNNAGYGFRFIPWSGNLPGEPAVVEFVNGYFYPGTQNIKVVYKAGYLIQSESWLVPVSSFAVTVLQPQGIWSFDNGVTYANGNPLTPVTSSPATGQYIPPGPTNPGVYTFSAGDVGTQVFISYSFIPADLEEACIQFVAERLSYRGRIGELDKSLGGQETIRYLRGGMGRSQFHGIPPEIEDLIMPYVSVIPPALGAPV